MDRPRAAVSGEQFARNGGPDGAAVPPVTMARGGVPAEGVANSGTPVWLAAALHADDVVPNATVIGGRVGRAQGFSVGVEPAYLRRLP